MSENNKNPQEIVIERFQIQGGSSKNMGFTLSDPVEENLVKNEYSNRDNSSPLLKALRNVQNINSKAPQLAFTENPVPVDNYLGLYKAKRGLIPDELLKQVRITDHLVAAILRARSGQISLYGHLRKDRFDVGIELEIKPEFYKILNSEQFERVKTRIKRFEQILLNCGHTEGLESQDKITLADFIKTQVSNGLTFGRFGTEVIYDLSGMPDEDGNYPFNRFRPVDIATIVKPIRKAETVGNNLREMALKALANITGEKIDIDVDKLKEDKYAWIQFIDGMPRQAFTNEELLVCTLFPSTDVEHNGYPVSPLDTVVSSVTTHISIDSYKKLYFQNGRASKGMLIIKSDEVDSQVLSNLKLEFSASINNVSNSFRTPIFGVGKEDEVQWMPMTGEGLGDEFQFMYDQIARNIMSAFSMSPDELPGYSHLSRGTNSQTLSESNNEFKLTAARDTGLRPLIMAFQTFFNQRLFPLIDPMLAKICEIKFEGLDAQSKEQESARLQQDSALHMSYNDILDEVDKDHVGSMVGGDMPFNERLQIVLDKYSNASEVRGTFFKDPAAFVDPMLNYKRDPFFLQYLQLLAQVNPVALKAYFAPKPFAMEYMKMQIEDMIEEEE